MNSEIENRFDIMVDTFKNLDNSDKKEEILVSIKELLSIIDHLATVDNISLKFLRSQEINDLYNPNMSDEDFLEALFVYIENVKEVLGQYLIYKIR